MRTSDQHDGWFEATTAGSLYEERLVEDVILLREVLAACASGDERSLRELGVLA
jgi:hypothetical protein